MTMRKNVIQWAMDRQLVSRNNAHAQTCKLLEECGELAGAILKDNREQIVDAIGDIQVVLIILSEQLGVDYENALENAYNEIKNRRGKTVNGSFVKETTNLSECCSQPLYQPFEKMYLVCMSCGKEHPKQL